MKLVVTDGATLSGGGVSLDIFSQFGEVQIYDLTAPEQLAKRVSDADGILCNKTPIPAELFDRCPKLRYVGECATGYNNIDIAAAKAHGVTVCNVAGYSTDAVAQHTFAMLFYLLEKMRYYDDYVKEERYVSDRIFTHFAEHFHELASMRFGIIGLGNIGRKVAQIASAFGADVVYYSASHQPPQEGYHQVDLDTLLATSDIISIHAPLTVHTQGLINSAALEKMKPSAILLNLGRGPIVVETDLANALKKGTIAAAGLDVLSQEPMTDDNPLLSIKDSKKLLITPHVAWAAIEARTRLMEIIYGQIKDFFSIS